MPLSSYEREINDITYTILGEKTVLNKYELVQKEKKDERFEFKSNGQENKHK